MSILSFLLGEKRKSASVAKERLQSLRRTNPKAKLATALLAIARDHGFSSWRAIKTHVEQSQVTAPFFEACTNGDVKALREAMDKLKDRLKSAAIVLSAVTDGKVSLIAGVTADLTGKIKAGELVNHVAQQVGGKGGGRPDMAQAGGPEGEKAAQALEAIENQLSQAVA